MRFYLSSGAAPVTASIYLWSYKSKVVISDVDGTITKSDLLGASFEKAGRDTRDGRGGRAEEAGREKKHVYVLWQRRKARCSCLAGLMGCSDRQLKASHCL